LGFALARASREGEAKAIQTRAIKNLTKKEIGGYSSIRSFVRVIHPRMQEDSF